MKALFDKVSIQCSRFATHTYSTSFSLGIFCLERSLRDPIHSIYGFVRFADEIVDSFHQYNKQSLFKRFKQSTQEAIDDGISLNPVLNAFQATVHQYCIQRELIDRFLESMEMDLYRTSYDHNGFKDYVTGSAGAVGLMCLRVFSNGNKQLYEQLSAPAMSLGSAFQKVNFLRDLHLDYSGMGRAYFPGVDVNRFDDKSKKEIEQSIENDFRAGFSGIRKLPRTARFGVYIAYMYYLALFKKIKNIPSQSVLQSRIRIPNRHKATLLAWSFVKHQLNII
jgi:15-cis-phytoene synthase